MEQYEPFRRPRRSGSWRQRQNYIRTHRVRQPVAAHQADAPPPPLDRVREWALRFSPSGIDPFAIRWTTSTIVAIVVGVAAAVLAVAAMGHSATPPGADPWTDPQAVAPPLAAQDSIVPISPVPPLPSDDPGLPGRPGAPAHGHGPAGKGLVPVGDVHPAPGTRPAPASTPSTPAHKDPTDPSTALPDGSAYHTIQGESFDGQSGIKSEANEKGNGVHIGFISNGDFARYDDVDFTDVPAHALLLSASNAARQNRSGEVELRLDSRSSAPIGRMTIPNNGDWFAFSTYRMSIEATTGVHTVFLTFTSGQDEEFANVDSFTFRR